MGMTAVRDGDSQAAGLQVGHAQCETTNELDPLKGLTLGCLLESRVEGGRESLGLKSLIQGSYWGNSKRT